MLSSLEEDCCLQEPLLYPQLKKPQEQPGLWTDLLICSLESVWDVTRLAMEATGCSGGCQIFSAF